MRRLIALTVALALALPLIIGFGSTPARAHGDAATNAALGLAAFAVFNQFFAPAFVAPPVVVRPAPVYRQIPVYREIPVYRDVPVYREVPVYRKGHGYKKVHPPVHRHGRPDWRGHGHPYHR